MCNSSYSPYSDEEFYYGDTPYGDYDYLDDDDYYYDDFYGSEVAPVNLTAEQILMADIEAAYINYNERVRIEETILNLFFESILLNLLDDFLAGMKDQQDIGHDEFGSYLKDFTPPLGNVDYWNW